MIIYESFPHIAKERISVFKMSSENSIDLCSDNEMGDSGGKIGEKRPYYAVETSELEGNNNYKIKKLRGNNNNSSSNLVGISQSGSSVLEQGCCVDDESSPSFSPSLCPPPVCRQFWKAGNYEMEQSAKVPIQKGRNHLRVHPLFLHSNATSHKWAFGAIAELLDNAVDEIQNGATFVVMDKMINPQDGSTALLIQDDGGGMDPEAIRRCMSFGFSEKKDKCAIGQYGNGFKTSSMRLGADVIVFSRHQGNGSQTGSQSIGLLSYTFLRQSAQDRIVVPLVDYELNESGGKYEPVFAHGKAQFSSNMSVMLQWSPYSTEEMLLKQFDDVGPHGTKIIVYNLWLSDDGEMELDFDSDVEDIRINADAKLFQAGEYANPILDQHIANLYRYSLRVYASILYRHLPQSFKIYLRGRVVEHHNIAYDLKFPEFVVYKPHSLGTPETAPVTTIIGFLKEAPDVNIHGFNIYHKNRLILPFWSVVKNRTNSKARGVVGLLEANFIEPTHSKQDFEKTSLFQKLEARLKDMTMEYWDFHCGLLGYHQIKKNPSSQSVSSWKLLPPREKKTYVEQPVLLNSNSSQGPKIKRKERNPTVEIEPKRMKLGSFTSDTLHNEVEQPSRNNETQLNDEETTLMQENQKLRSLLLVLERREEDLNLKVQQLRDDLGDARREYARLLAELESTVKIKS